MTDLILEDIITESEYLVLTNLLGNYSKMLTMEEYVMEADSDQKDDKKDEKPKGKFLSNVKNAVMKVLDMIVNSITKIGNGFKKLQDKSYQKTMDMIANDKEKCGRLGKEMEDAVSELTTEYFVQEVSASDLKKAANLGAGVKNAADDFNLWRSVAQGKKLIEQNKQIIASNKNKERIAQAAIDAAKAAEDGKLANKIVKAGKTATTAIGGARTVIGNTINDAGKFIASMPTEAWISASSIAGIIICAKILIALARKADYKFPMPDEVTAALNDLSDRSRKISELAFAINQIKETKSLVSGQYLGKQAVPTVFVLSNKTRDVVDRANNWKRVYDRNKHIFTHSNYSEKSLTSEQTNLLVDAVYFASTIKSTGYWKSLETLQKDIKKLKTEIGKFTDDKLSKLDNKIYNRLATLSKTCVDFVMEIQLVQLVGSDMIRHLDLSAKRLKELKAKKLRRQHKSSEARALERGESVGVSI